MKEIPHSSPVRAQVLRRRCAILTIALGFVLFGSQSSLGASVAVIGDVVGAEAWCDLLTSNDHECVNLSGAGPVSLEPYDVVINLGWADPDGLLADHMRMAKGVITWGNAPDLLGIDTDSTVQDWIGANAYGTTVGPHLIIMEEDPILGRLEFGLHLWHCLNGPPCSAILDTSGHPDAKVIGEYLPRPVEPIDSEFAILRNTWMGGQSVYFTNGIAPGVDQVIEGIIVRAVGLLSVSSPTVSSSIPTVSAWGLAVMALLVLTAGTLVMAARRRPAH